MSKNLLQSKTFWFNVAAVAAQWAGLVPLSAEQFTTVIGAVNVVLRYVTKGQVHIFGEDSL